MHAFSCTAAHTVNGHERGSLNRSAPVSYATTLSIHRALRLTLKDRGRAQRAVDTSRWLYNKIETKPERERLREFGGLPHCPGIVLASYAASLNTYSDLHKLWCAVRGLNQSRLAKRLALICYLRTFAVAWTLADASASVASERDSPVNDVEDSDTSKRADSSCSSKEHVEGGFEKAAHHAQLAHAHHVEAIEHARNAAKEHLKAHGKKK